MTALSQRELAVAIRTPSPASTAAIDHSKWNHFLMTWASKDKRQACRKRIVLVSHPIVLLALGGSATAEPSTPVANVFAPGVISEPFIDTAPTLAPDGKTVYFQHNNGVRSAIVVSRLSRKGWSRPSRFPSLVAGTISNQHCRQTAAT